MTTGLHRQVHLTSPAVVQLQCFVKSVKDDFILESQGTRLAMILGPILACEPG